MNTTLFVLWLLILIVFTVIIVTDKEKTTWREITFFVMGNIASLGFLL